MLINYDDIVNKLARDLDVRVKRSELIGSNIANIDTPAYKARDLKFHEELTGEIGKLGMKKTHPKHMGALSDTHLPHDVVENPNPGRPDGNNVNIDDEMLKLTENNIKYNVAVQLLSKSLRRIQTAIEQSK